jgi:sugar lactone lactonase YvrE
VSCNQPPLAVKARLLASSRAMSSPRLLIKGLTFPECPRWRDGALFVSDMHAHKLIKLTLDGRVETLATLDDRPGGLGFLPDGRLLVVSQLEKKLLVWDGGRLLPYADLTLSRGEANDLVVDSKGRGYVSCFGFDLHGGAAPAPAPLLFVDEHAAVRIVADELMFPNGMVLTPDERTLIVAETGGARLTAYDVAADGSLSGRRLFADLDGRAPDGICLDAEGAVWAASFFSGEFVRVADGGKVLEIVDVGQKRAVACMLGGDDRRELLMATAHTDLMRLARGDSEGFIEAQRVAVPGAGLP